MDRQARVLREAAGSLVRADGVAAVVAEVETGYGSYLFVRGVGVVLGVVVVVHVTVKV